MSRDTSTLVSKGLDALRSPPADPPKQPNPDAPVKDGHGTAERYRIDSFGLVWADVDGEYHLGVGYDELTVKPKLWIARGQLDRIEFRFENGEGEFAVVIRGTALGRVCRDLRRGFRLTIQVNASEVQSIVVTKIEKEKKP